MIRADHTSTIATTLQEGIRIDRHRITDWDNAPSYERTSVKRTNARQVRGRHRPADSRSHKRRR